MFGLISKITAMTGQRDVLANKSTNLKSIDATLQRFLEELVDTWNRGNVASFGRLFAEDANYVTGSGVRLSGRGQIQDLVYARSPTSAVPGQVSVATESVKMVGSDAAVILSAWHMGPANASTTCEPVVRSGVMTIVAQRTGGTWQIIALHNTDTQR